MDVNEAAAIPSGGFSAWLSGARRALNTREGADVPCGDCRGCCTSSYFIHIRPEETDTLAHVPKALRFRAPGLPKGHVLMGYSDNGHCPMFKDGNCSIYAHRPQTCRDYDCRIFPATGIPVEEGRATIADRTARWKFDFSLATDKREFSAVQAAAAFVRAHAAEYPPGFQSANPTQQAALALKVYEVFLEPEVISMHDIKMNTDRHRFELEAEGRVAFTAYRESEGAIEFVHTVVPPELEGKGIGSALAKHVLGYAKDKGLKAIVTCPFIKTWLAKHPEAA